MWHAACFMTACESVSGRHREPRAAAASCSQQGHAGRCGAGRGLAADVLCEAGDGAPEHVAARQSHASPCVAQALRGWRHGRARRAGGGHACQAAPHERQLCWVPLRSWCVAPPCERLCIVPAAASQRPWWCWPRVVAGATDRDSVRSCVCACSARRPQPAASVLPRYVTTLQRPCTRRRVTSIAFAAVFVLR
jgi:hypothetical protein